MTSLLMTLDYEDLVASELKKATRCQTDECRKRHLDRAAIYAHRGEKADAGSMLPKPVLDLIGTLSTALDEADDLGLTMAALHINQAIVELGGVGTYSSGRGSED